MRVFDCFSSSQRDGGEADADSPLHTAVKGCDTDTIQQLLDNSANVDSQVCFFNFCFASFLLFFFQNKHPFMGVFWLACSNCFHFELDMSVQ